MIDKRKTQEVNAGSMADIAFLLLIFFLVATTMNVDTGINRILPPLPPEDVKQEEILVKERNLLLVHVNMYNNVQVAHQPVQINQIKDRVKDFLVNRYNDENLPEKEVVNIDLIGDFPVGKGVVSLQNDRGTLYDTYVQVQNELTKALNEIRDDISMTYFGKKFSDLDKEQQEAVQQAQPNQLSEAEPINIGGGR